MSDDGVRIAFYIVTDACRPNSFSANNPSVSNRLVEGSVVLTNLLNCSFELLKWPLSWKRLWCETSRKPVAFSLGSGKYYVIQLFRQQNADSSFKRRLHPGRKSVAVDGDSGLAAELECSGRRPYRTGARRRRRPQRVVRSKRKKANFFRRWTRRLTSVICCGRRNSDM